jgi:hypothetical protein
MRGLPLRIITPSYGIILRDRAGNLKQSSWHIKGSAPRSSSARSIPRVVYERTQTNDITPCYEPICHTSSSRSNPTDPEVQTRPPKTPLHQTGSAYMQMRRHSERSGCGNCRSKNARRKASHKKYRSLGKAKDTGIPENEIATYANA